MRGNKIKVKAKITIEWSKDIFKKGDILHIQSILRDKDLTYTKHVDDGNGGLKVVKCVQEKKGDYIYSVIILPNGKEYDARYTCQGKTLDEVFEKIID